MRTPDHESAIAYALRRLREELPPGLTYHNLYHTEKDVMPAALRLAELCGLTEEELDLLQVAAAYHDIGFIETYAGHEQVGVRIAAQVLPSYGFSTGQVERITSLILATRLPQSPSGLLEEILVDADLDVLGRPDFLERSIALRQENIGRGNPIAERTWFEQQLAFLQRHGYFTQAAHDLRDEGKLRNMALLKERLGKG